MPRETLLLSEGFTGRSVADGDLAGYRNAACWISSAARSVADGDLAGYRNDNTNIRRRDFSVADGDLAGYRNCG